jgi:MYXO-CTERM domain-containing protein
LIGGGGGGAQNAWGTLIHRSTRALDLSADGTATFGGFGGSGLLLNPTPKNKRIVVLQSSVTFGLGGAAAATNAVPGAFGAGHYATLTTDDATLGGALDVALFYGFTPVVGQTFQIINIGTVRIGEFDGLGEGSLVKRFGDVGLYLSYAGGDGNDVVLTAASVPAPGAAALFGMGGLLAARRRRS